MTFSTSGFLFLGNIYFWAGAGGEGAGLEGAGGKGVGREGAGMNTGMFTLINVFDIIIMT